jgi:hypothetical protein
MWNLPPRASYMQYRLVRIPKSTKLSVMTEQEVHEDQGPRLNAHAEKSISGEAVHTSPWTEEMPKFSVNSKELQTFLVNNLGLPNYDSKTGIQVHVSANFFVDANGKVSDIEITELAETVF